MMAGGPGASDGVAPPWGGVVMKTGGEGAGHRGQGANKPAPQGCPSVALSTIFFCEFSVACSSGNILCLNFFPIHRNLLSYLL